MEISIVRQRLLETMDRAKRRAAERRTRTDAAGQAFGVLLEHTAIPLFKQVANVLRAEGHVFGVTTPSGSVRLASDRRAEDFIELTLDSSGERPVVMLHTSRSWGGGVIESERALTDPEALTEEDLLTALLQDLQRFVER
jgi:hypothetical protein